MEYFYVAAALIAGIYAYTYARTIWEDRNTAGAAFVVLLVVLSIGLPIFRILKKP